MNAYYHRWLIVLLIGWLSVGESYGWGFYAHRRINRMAVFLLPPEMLVFFKHNIQFLTENAVNPDRRRYAVEGEAPRHFLDADVYGDSAVYKLPRYWTSAVAQYTEDTLMAYGIVPWHIERVQRQLTRAFAEKDTRRILSLAADLGHYIGDGNVPLHTTENYNGQLSGQYGIHGFWESRLPELFFEQYDFFFDEPASYLPNTQLRAWQAVIEAHEALDSVLRFERLLTERMGVDRKYAFETRGNVNVRVYSRDFSTAYHQMLDGQIERRLRATVKMVADFWFTAWVDAGQPDLSPLVGLSKKEIEALEKEQKQLLETPNTPVPTRTHDDYGAAIPTPAQHFGQAILWAATRRRTHSKND
ncbi:MAG: zinc dependent phospholipase C family protein [Bernardetiaceae bacterium]